mgnify:CR=1 FL=1
MDYIEFLKGKIKLAEFGGLMTVPYRAILNGRKGSASELNTGYFFDGCQYLAAAEKQMDMPDLFAALDMEQAA